MNSARALTMAFGSVIEIDLATAKARVQIGDIESDWLPWLAPCAGFIRVWTAPALGEQVVVLASDNDIEGACIIGALFSDEVTPPADHTGITIAFDDGAIIAYDPSAKELVASLPDGGTTEITSPGGLTITAEGGVTMTGDVTITGAVSIEGDVDVAGKVTASDDVIAAGKSLKGHKHLGVQAGAAQSGVPV
jgi:phage baseplate assembly protein V